MSKGTLAPLVNLLIAAMEGLVDCTVRGDWSKLFGCNTHSCLTANNCNGQGKRLISWLIVIPIEELGFCLNKGKLRLHHIFWDVTNAHKYCICVCVCHSKKKDTNHILIPQVICFFISVSKLLTFWYRYGY